jgi:Ca2+-binding RTX toxin-like protein
MRRAVVLLMVVAAMLAVAGGIALATQNCTGGGDCIGTREADAIIGSQDFPNRIAAMEGNDTINGGPLTDEIYGDEGNDTINSGAIAIGVPDSDVIYGDEGNDTIDVRDNDSGPDTVNCGPGKKDKVSFDKSEDVIANNCEVMQPQ